MKGNYLKIHYFATCCVIAVVIILLTVLKPLAQGTSQIQSQDDMNYSPESPSGEHLSATPSDYQHSVTQLGAEEFHFETHIDFSPLSLTNAAQYTESITHDNGTFAITLMEQGNTINYIFQVSSLPAPACESHPARACNTQAAPARGNVAEIQIALPGHQLLPGNYSFGEGASGESASISGNDVIVYSRQLYSDPSHGQVGCQVWGAGVLTVTRADYDTNRQLKYLEANIVRACNQTAPLPILPPQDAALNAEVEEIQHYTYHASWRCRLTSTAIAN